MRYDWGGRENGGRGPATRQYERGDVVYPAAVAEDPAESGAGDAGAARRAADKGPDDDRDRWRDFSKDDAKRLADDPAAPVDAEIPKGGQARDGGRVD